MNSLSSQERAPAVALAQFSLVSKVQELVAQPGPRKIALETGASSSARPTPAGVSPPVAVRTLEDGW
jgi:hypothetical protein